MAGPSMVSWRFVWRIAEVVHEADIEDERYEAPGLDALIRGLSTVRDDPDLLKITRPLFDGFYEYVAQTDPAGSRTRGHGPRPRADSTTLHAAAHRTDTLDAMRTDARTNRRVIVRWLGALMVAAVAAVIYRYVVPAVVALYTHPEELRDRVGPASDPKGHSRGDTSD